MSIAAKRYSVEDYLTLERASEIKHEFFDGEIFAMAGASESHNFIVGNLVREIGIIFKDRDCVVYPSDIRVRCRTGLHTYPDVTIVCGQREYDDEPKDTLLNPTVLIEVLSPSTEAYDRGRKFDHYMTIESLKEYVLVSQDRTSISHFERQEDGHWLLTSITQMDQSLVLPSVDVSLPLTEIYDKVEFPPEEDLPEGSEMRA